MRKTWQQKYDTRSKPIVRVAKFDYADVKAGDRLLITTPAEIDCEIQKIPAKCESSLGLLRRDLALGHNADKTCPITAGICLHIVAEVAIEKMAKGATPSEVTPFWRVISPESGLATKLTCGLFTLRVLRRREGLNWQPKSTSSDSELHNGHKHKRRR